MIEIFSHILAANESREVALSGEYFEIRNAVSPIVLVELMDKSGGLLSRLAAPEQSDFVRPGNFQTIRITNGPTAQTIKYFVGSGDAGSRRTSGLVRIDGTSEVSVVDGGKSRSISGAAFIASSVLLGLQGSYAQTAIHNPEASGKRIFINAVAVSSFSASSIYLSSGAFIPSGTGNQIVSKNLASSLVSACRKYDSQNLTAYQGNVFAGFTVPSGLLTDLKLTEPLVLEPGRFLNITNRELATSLTTFLNVWEEAI